MWTVFFSVSTESSDLLVKNCSLDHIQVSALCFLMCFIGAAAVCEVLWNTTFEKLKASYEQSWKFFCFICVIFCEVTDWLIHISILFSPGADEKLRAFSYGIMFFSPCAPDRAETSGWPTGVSTQNVLWRAMLDLLFYLSHKCLQGWCISG